MKFKAEIDVMPLDALLDPQGKAVTSSMKNIGLDSIESVRIGRHVSLLLEASNMEDANKIIEEACQKLLANQIMEKYSYQIEKA
ncbi:MAG: phosphoribosylformylglycinamidine synthase [Crocinitomicaceae bacterium]|nr:phosphoribosylformylglycinamidine synthase [Crocinitomicaceae bacterium]|tara:strand:+ start:11528 stop:11779 length:252 start_codon:yes stop_codon:yes gene_type:complete